jgi:branched-subunit amino acid aminotransferase/4-amino-4-deoxychorismate lyase
VNTSQYDPQTRKHLKRFQRSFAYLVMKKEHVAERERLETKLRERNEAIARLSKKLLEAGFKEDEIAKLAA